MTDRRQERQEIKNNSAVVRFNEERCVLKPNASPKDLEELSKHVNFPIVLTEVARHKNTTIGTLTQLAYVANELNNHELLIALQANPCLPFEHFKLLALDKRRNEAYYNGLMTLGPRVLDDEIFKHVLEVAPAALARCNCVPPDVLTKVFYSAPLSNRSLLNNRLFPIEEIVKLVDESLIVEYLIALASCPRLPDEQIRKLARHENRSVRVAVAHNPSCPADVLNELFNSGRDEAIDYEIACNPSCPEELRLRLVASPDFKAVLEVAKQTSSEDVFMKILRRSKRIDKEWRHKLQLALVKNKNFDSCFLERVEHHDEFDWVEDEELEEALADRGVIEDK